MKLAKNRKFCNFCKIRKPALARLSISIKLQISAQRTEKSQNLLNLKLKRKIVKFAKFVTAFNPGHKCEGNVPILRRRGFKKERV